ncbi:beta-ketoacyl-[acyl-carrier-protein] synthase family protein [Actinacidiphila paucisporea]|uniref:Beta-ketoacyl synthase N-terminal domain-containing protein n=1 Tax=Actinacidiphila paucisporea TaxID=310782 RepID=A0A1M7I596_9ACTN|nr:hypothetical protein [Actinacidiphila paucisporea]SHM35577.1 hypothetical protein SAMN05216499_110140 [Actinacidiphila paucisporea]
MTTLTARRPLPAQAESAGLRVLAAAAWPELPGDAAPPELPGFVRSSFSPLAAETAHRCLTRRPSAAPGDALADPGRQADAEPAAGGARVTAVVVVSAFGDLAGARHVAEVVDRGGALSPLMFFQAVPNAVAGHVAARWELDGPVVCVADAAAGIDVARLLIEDGDADEALLIRVEQGLGAAAQDRAEAVLVTGTTSHSGGEQP